MSFVRVGISLPLKSDVVDPRLPQGNDSNEVEIATEQIKEGQIILGQ